MAVRLAISNAAHQVEFGAIAAREMVAAALGAGADGVRLRSVADIEPLVATRMADVAGRANMVHDLDRAARLLHTGAERLREFDMAQAAHDAARTAHIEAYRAWDMAAWRTEPPGDWATNLIARNVATTFAAIDDAIDALGELRITLRTPARTA